ncbi:toll/interleukin-1 receptor domain-containing protein [Sedimentibacter saalensis]|uniref:TIR domain-containing protein n=1 Tax=Sedimentibacter saalensis TaxID=130788 RepID=A0A562JJS6_9FIRM|nr:toll/interleukin-1 receptor domain-containing protein [Sedimentibacter saalensis]TWH83457.1 TIR domain-containing protein [Sedimentibacter saalensis]
MMRMIFCNPELTMKNTESADIFFKECNEILNIYVADRLYISSVFQMNQLLAVDANKNDIFVFFTAENGEYNEKFLKLIQKYNDAKSRIWAIAMENNPECRRPPEPVSEKQSFDVSCRNENRNPMKNNMKAIAQIFARKIISQTLSPLYRDEVLYFISHRRVDGEHIAAKLADELKRLTRERNVYRDVVNVEVGDDAQKDIDINLELSDAMIFLQTQEAQYSSYIMKELCYALINDIPILWIQIDNSSYSKLEIRPGEAPVLRYMSEEFDNPDRLIEIVDEIEEKCFHLIMNSSNQVYSHIECLIDMCSANKIKLACDMNAILAYEVQYKEKIRDLYDTGIRNHYIQCFGRNPKEQDIQQFVKRVKESKTYDKNDRLFLLSNHGQREKQVSDAKVTTENFDDYLINIENVYGSNRKKLNKRIILSGAFPDCDEIYKSSLLESVLVYSREIIKKGYTLVFGAHPTFQKLIFDIGRIYSSDIKYSIEMHMDKAYMVDYDIEELQEKCTLVLSDGLKEMRENMICKEKSELLICLGGKIKEDKSLQGVDIEVEMAKSVGIPVALVGTVGGRSSEYAFERLTANDWSELNPWSKSLNEGLFYNVNHRMMVKRLLDIIEHER